jgi:hypothetical protein
MRCIICDYTPDHGSDYADLQPHIFKVHATPQGDYLCDECLAVSDENLYELGLEDDEEEA